MTDIINKTRKLQYKLENKIKNIPEEIVVLGIAIFVSCLFYYIHSKPGMLITRLDYGYLMGGMILPYVLPLFIVLKNKKR